MRLRYEYDIDNVGRFTVDVIDSVKDYVELMQKIFDFSKVTSNAIAHSFK